jgi:hypothetical protein
MCRKALIFQILLLLSIPSPAVKAGDSIALPSSLAGELSGSLVRMPSDSVIHVFLSQKDYQYGGPYVPPKEAGILYRFWKWIGSLFNYGMKALRYMPLMLKIAFYVLCAIFLFVIITKTKLYKVFYTDTELPEPEYFEVNPLEGPFDFGEAVRMQLSKQHFRDAIRLLHLMILKELENQGMITCSREKTNREYAREIADSRLKTSFHELAGIYNRVWFGNYNLTRDEYESLASGFYQFTEAIHAQKE